MHEGVEGGDDRVAVLDTDVGPDAGVSGRDARHVAEPTRGQPEQGGVLLGSFGGEPHQGCRREVGYVRDDRDQRVVLLRRERDHVGAEGRHDRPHARVCLGVGVDRRGEDPRGPGEELGIGAVHALLLGTGHGVAPHETGMVHARHDRGLHPADVGDDAAASDRARGLCRDRRHRDRYERELGVGIVAHRVERPQVVGACGTSLVDVAAGDVPAPCPQREPDGTSDQPRADDLSPGGHHADPWHPRGTRGGAPVGRGRW